MKDILNNISTLDGFVNEEEVKAIDLAGGFDKNDPPVVPLYNVVPPVDVE